MGEEGLLYLSRLPGPPINHIAHGNFDMLTSRSLQL